VAVCLVPYPDYQLGILEGVRAYLAEHSDAFEILTHEGNPYLRAADLAPSRPDGVIANIRQDTLALFESLRGPVVKIGSRGPVPLFSSVEMDGEQAGRVAASHLLGLGLQTLGCVEVAGAAWSESRARGFQAGAKACQVPVASHDLAKKDEVEITDRAALASWLKQLPRPAGIFCVTDLLARRVVEVARASGLQVPRDLAVLGFNNGLYECLFAEPHLSSVPQDRQRLGFEAARLMHDRLMNPAADVLAAPVLVRAAAAVSRRTTATLAWQDPVLRDCIDYFHRQLGDGASVDDVFKAYPERRLQLTRRLSPADGGAVDKAEAARLRLVLAEKFLRETDLPLLAVAEFSGFWEEARLGLAFQDAFGHAPAEYRARFGRAD
jgi:LacI family transcriptional regulator